MPSILRDRLPILLDWKRRILNFVICVFFYRHPPAIFCDIMCKKVWKQLLSIIVIEFHLIDKKKITTAKNRKKEKNQHITIYQNTVRETLWYFCRLRVFKSSEEGVWTWFFSFPKDWGRKVWQTFCRRHDFVSIKNTVHFSKDQLEKYPVILLENGYDGAKIRLRVTSTRMLSFFRKGDF